MTVMTVGNGIFSLETEYGVAFFPDAETLPQSQVCEEVVRIIRRQLGWSETIAFLRNGGKVHVDVGHVEWSLPECLSAEEASLHDRSADECLAKFLGEAEQALASKGAPGKLRFIKNNRDTEGNTFGCHENYSMISSIGNMSDDQSKSYLIYCLLPFLSSRPLICGAGAFTPEGAVPFQISQRADFMACPASTSTTGMRGIVNLGREDEPLGDPINRRVHLICGDANMGSWSTWMKLGTTGLVLRMIAAMSIGDVPALANPVTAMMRISRDPAATAKVPLRNGRLITGVELQWRYLEAAEDFVVSFGERPEDKAILDAWANALDRLESAPGELSGHADWATKLRLMEHRLAEWGCDWQQAIADRDRRLALQRLDLDFHTLGDDGLFARLPKDPVSGAWGPWHLARAQSSPPPFTRARQRASLISILRAAGTNLDTMYWTQAPDGSVMMLDPFAFCHPRDGAAYEAALIQGLNAADPAIRHKAVILARDSVAADLRERLATVAASDVDEHVRLAAVATLGAWGDGPWTKVLFETLRLDAPRLRLMAEEALAVGECGRPRSDTELTE